MTKQEMSTENPARKQGYRPVHKVKPVEINWIDGPPPAGDGGHYSSFDHFRIARLLRERPYQWALLKGLTMHGCSGINKGALAAYRPSGSYEAVLVDDQIYARFVGLRAAERAELLRQISIELMNPTPDNEEEL